MNKVKKRLDDFYGISKNNSSFKIEIIAGVATFLAMAYILIVNPNSILYDGAENPIWTSLFIATAFGAIIGTLLMSIYAKMPFAQASGMGLNSTLGMVIGGGIGAYGYNYNYSLANGLLLVVISGIVFLILSIVPIGKNKDTNTFITLREKIFDGMPNCIKKAIPVGIGLFIAFIGLQNAKFISSNEFVLLELVDFTKIFTGKLTDPSGNLYNYTYALTCLSGFIAICILSHYKVKGAVILGIFIATIVSIPLGVANFDILLGNTTGITWKFWENIGSYFGDNGLFFLAVTDWWDFPSQSILTSIMLVITFAMIDMFDTMGTVVGCATNAGLIDKDGKPLNYNKIMISDSVATVAGALIGTSTVTTFVESGTGVAAGGKTGFSSLITALLFLVSIFLIPLFAFIPSSAAACALIYVGVLMMGNVVNIDFKDVRGAAVSFITIIMMVLTYSITKGIGMGVVSYVFIYLVCYLVDLIRYRIQKDKYPKPKFEISIVSLVVFVLFLVYFTVPTVL